MRVWGHSGTQEPELLKYLHACKTSQMAHCNTADRCVLSFCLLVSVSHLPSAGVTYKTDAASPVSHDSVAQLQHCSGTKATNWNSAAIHFIGYTCAFSLQPVKTCPVRKALLKVQTHKAVCIQGSSAPAGALSVATLVGVSTEAPAVALRGAHGLCH